LDLDETLIHSC